MQSEEKTGFRLRIVFVLHSAFKLLHFPFYRFRELIASIVY